VGQEAICSKEEFLTFETWEHKEVRVGTHILPFILALAGVVFVGFAVFRIYKKYQV
jgi:hypothetical protein